MNIWHSFCFINPCIHKALASVLSIPKRRIIDSWHILQWLSATVATVFGTKSHYYMNYDTLIFPLTWIWELKGMQVIINGTLNLHQGLCYNLQSFLAIWALSSFHPHTCKHKGLNLPAFKYTTKWPGLWKNYDHKQHSSPNIWCKLWFLPSWQRN